MTSAAGGIDAVSIELRAADFARRSLDEACAIDLAIRCVDLTTLEGRDTPDHVAALCARAARPAPDAPPVAAVCVYPALVGDACDALRASAVRVASVATAFPSGLSSLSVKLADVADALEAGADEIDMVIDRGALLAGNHERVADEIRRVRSLCAGATLKVILETGELGTYAAIRVASDLALEAGADFIKTSTGKIGVSATLSSALVMAYAIRDFERRTGERRGLKIAGGVRSASGANAYITLVGETLGEPWLDPRLFRIGASSLLDDLLQKRRAVDARAGALR